MTHLQNPLFMFVVLAAAVFAAPASGQDQTRDGSFGNWGVGLYAYAANSSDEALRIFPSFESHCDEGGCYASSIYYVAGFTRANGASTLQPAVLVLDEDGEPLASFGNSGWLILPPQMDQITDVDWDPMQRRLYFAGTGFGTKAAVACVDLYAQAMCSGFGIAGQGLVTLEYGASYKSLGDAIVFDSEFGLLVSGRAWHNSGDGDWVGVARLDPATGAFNTVFGTGGRRLYSNAPRLIDNRMNVNAMALATSADVKNRRHLYVGGNFRADFDVHDSFDGFVLAVSGRNGAPITGYGGGGITAWLPVKYEYQSSYNRQDAVTALSVLANGQLAMLGWTENATPNLNRSTLFARFNPDGTRDVRSCSSPPSGDNNACWEVQHQGFGATTATRAAILEHPINRDLISFFSTDSGSSGSSHTIVQSSATFKTRHGHGGFYIDGSASGASDAAWESLAISRMLYAGWHARSETPAQREFMVLRALMGDAIFADQFGGALAD